MNRNTNIILFIFASLLSIFFIQQSHLGIDVLLSPMSTVFKMFTGTGLGINWLLLILGILFSCVSLASFIIYVYDNPGDNFILICSAIISIITIVLNSFSIHGILFALGIFITYLYILTSMKSKKGKMRSPTIFNTSLLVSSTAITLINLFIAIAVFSILAVNSSYADREMSSLSMTMFDMNISDIDNLSQQILSQQKQTAYAQAEMIETAVLYSIYDETGGLTYQEKKKCFEAVNSSMNAIDRRAKASIDLQLAQASSSSSPQLKTIESTINLLNLFKQYYPFITFLTIFMILEMFKLFLRYIVAVTARLLWMPP
ncbi:MAG: hypothetical protein U9P44_01275 [archaeon]|nr:hypothetical protein [archaeon]